MLFKGSTSEKRWIVIQVIARIFIVGFLPSHGLVQTTRQYKLGYNYDPSSPTGPSNWASIDASKVGDWSDFTCFMNKTGQDLKIGINECANNNKNQRTSPVNLYPTMACDDDHEILCKIVRKDECGFKNMTFEIAPNTLRASMPYVNTTCLNPTMNKSGKLPNDWIFIWLEVHARSEHVIDGRRFDGEINLIHVGINEQKRELAIPTILLDASSPFDQPLLQRFLDKWQQIYDSVRGNCSTAFNTTDSRLMKQEAATAAEDLLSMLDNYRAVVDSHKYVASDYYGDDQDIKLQSAENGGSFSAGSNRSLQTNTTASNTTSATASNATFYGPPYKYGQPFGPRRKQFPYDLFPTIYHYKYMGALTSPPCSTIVRWDVFDEPLKISRRQLRQIGALMGSYVNEQTCVSESVVSPSGENYRPLQVLSPQQNSAHCQLDRYRYWLYPTQYQ